MGKKTKTGGRGRLDKYYHLAKEQGYRSRAAFKLIQLNRKYDFLGNAKAMLDLCAAPGGWMQVAAKTMPVASLIIGVDLVPIKPVRGTRTILGDITTQECRAKIKKEAAGSMMDVVVHDGAPNVGGAWSSEAYTQSALVLDSLKLATEFLAPKGVFVTKIFRSQDYNALLYAMQQLFDKVEPTKPAASRNTSAEIFVVCTGYKAPAKIDPKLLDAKFLFQEVVEAKRPMGPEALFKQKVSQKRHRDGYEEGVSSLHRVASALSFVVAERPVEMLGTFTRLELDGPASWVAEGVKDAKELAHAIRTDAGTTTEIAALCKDLQVLGRSEFKQLLKWRLSLRKAMKDELGPVGGLMGGVVPKAKKQADAKPRADGDADDEEGDADDPETKLLSEMRDVQARMAADVKRDKKKRHEMKVKSRVRAAQMAASEGIAGDSAVADGLFSLGVLKGKDSLSRVLDVSAPGEADLDILEASSGSDEDDQTEVDHDDDDEDDADLRYEAEMEAGLEESYRSYMERQGHRKAAAKEKRMRLGQEGELDEDAAAGEGANKASADSAGGKDDGGARHAGSSEDEESGDEEEDEEEEEAGDGLLVSLDKNRAGVAKTGAAMAAQWFRQDVFDDPDLVEDERPEEAGQDEAAGLGTSGLGRTKSGAPARPAKQHAGQAAADEDDDEPSGSNSEDEDGEEGPSGRTVGALGFDIVPVGAAAGAAGSRGGAKGAAGAGGLTGDDDADSETDSEDEFDMLDDQGKAEVLALAKRMLRRREKESIIDAAYNRFAFHDTHLPKWFADDERRHMRPIAMVTKAEVDEEKERLRAIDARPIKKVAEAKARRRKIAQGKLQQARQKANAVVDNDDVAGRSKQREIEKIYAKARSSISNSRGGKGGKKGRGSGKPLDARMRKDMRATKSIAKANKGKKGRGGGGGRGGKGGGRGGKGGGKKGAASNRKSRD